MLSFLIFAAQRLINAIGLLLAVVILNFILIHMAPGSIVDTIAGEMGYSENNIVEDHSFYGAHPSTIIEILKDLDDSASHAAVFGHNPTFHSLVEQLANTTIEKFPTCAAATISLDINTWLELKATSGTLTALRLPRDYTDKKT